MKRFCKVIAVLLILSMFATVAHAGPTWRGIIVDPWEIRVWVGDYHSDQVWVDDFYEPIIVHQHGTLIIIGNLYIGEFSDIRINGNLFVAGRIIGDRSVAIGCNAWQLSPVFRGLMLGGFAILLVSFIAFVAWILT